MCEVLKCVMCAFISYKRSLVKTIKRYIYIKSTSYLKNPFEIITVRLYMYEDQAILYFNK